MDLVRKGVLVASSGTTVTVVDIMASRADKKLEPAREHQPQL